MEILDMNYLKTISLDELNKKLEEQDILLYDTLSAIDIKNKNSEYLELEWEYTNPETDKIVLAIKHNISNLKTEINLRR